jgi:hypothetical protein
MNGGFQMIGDWIDKVEYPQVPAMTDNELAAFWKKLNSRGWEP